MQALGCNKATYDRLKKCDWIVEYCDAKLHDGDDTSVDLKPSACPSTHRIGQEECESVLVGAFVQTPARLHHLVDYAVYWGAVDEEERCKMSEMIEATDGVATRVRVWISMPLVPV